MKTVNEKVTSSPSAHSSGPYYLTYVALLALLAATVGVAYVNLGHFNLPVALAIAAVKAGLVLWFFMHLRDSPRIVVLFLAAGLFILFIATLFTMADYLTRG